MTERDPNTEGGGKVATVAPPGPGAVTGGADEGPDPLASLHKMSTTAGLTYGGQEYVAVNVVAVVAVLLAVVGALSLVADILLVIPLAAVVCAVIAVRQIRDSNGTQTGRWLAALAIVLSLAFAGMVGTRKIMETMQLRSDNRQIEALIEGLAADVKAQKWQSAYSRFTDRFQKRFNLQQFTDRWGAIQKSQYFGPIKGMKGNGLLDMMSDNQTGWPLAGTMVIIESADPNIGEVRQEGYFLKGPEGWKIETIPAIFPNPGRGQQ